MNFSLNLTLWIILKFNPGALPVNVQPGPMAGAGTANIASVDPFDGNMVTVKGGAFIMGCVVGADHERCWEGAAYKVTISNFEIGQTEVTQAQWRAVMESDPPLLHFTGCDKCPVESVSWYEVQEFLVKLNQISGKKYRLPTSAEWEYAAREGAQATVRYKYAGSNNITEVAWTGLEDGCNNKTFPVKGKKPNRLGLYDMSGNVREWCADWAPDDAYNQNRPEMNPAGPDTGKVKVVRGGAYNDQYGGIDYFSGVNLCNYGSSFPSFRMDNIGFRIARSLD